MTCFHAFLFSVLLLSPASPVCHYLCANHISSTTIIKLMLELAANGSSCLQLLYFNLKFKACGRVRFILLVYSFFHSIRVST